MITTFKSDWVNEFNTNHDYYLNEKEKLNTPGYLAQQWEIMHDYDGFAEVYFSRGISSLYADSEEELFSSFLNTSISIVNRAIEEKAFQSDKCLYAFPRNRGCALKLRAYSNFLINGVIDSSDLIQASEDFEAHTQKYKGKWDSQVQTYYLNAVITALLAEDTERFIALMSTRKKFSWHQQEYKIYKSIFEDLKNGNSEQCSAYRESFHEFFDELRDPAYQPEVFLEKDNLTLELAIIWFKYFEKEEFNSQRVTDFISR